MSVRDISRCIVSNLWKERAVTYAPGLAVLGAPSFPMLPQSPLGRIRAEAADLKQLRDHPILLVVGHLRIQR